MNRRLALKRGNIPLQSLSRASVCLLLLLILAGCGPLSAFDPEAPSNSSLDSVPEPGEFSGWTAAGELEVYDYEDLYSLVDGQADAYFAYGFDRVAVQHYENAEGVQLRVRIWRLATPADAYGLYTSSASGMPVPVGNGGHSDEGRYLAFWQDRYYVELFAIPTLAGPQALQDLARAVSARLPAGGAPPALLDRLPSDGLEPDSTVFFHEEISIQDYLWLGGENLLGLSPETTGVLARYDIGNEQPQLLLVHYPTEAAAAAGLASLERSDLALVTAGVQGPLLGAVFGEIGAAEAKGLLASALAEP